jgi:phenylalanyl-tRNA synthetase beta chain
LLAVLLEKLSVSQDKWNIQPYKSAQISEGLCYSINEIRILTLGHLDNQVLSAFDCRQPVLYSEINWDMLISLIPGEEIQYKGIPKFPEVRRDLALLLDHEITFDQIEKIAFQTEKKLLKKVGLFDVYESDKIATGKKSYAISFILQDEDKTLTDKEIEKTMGRLIQALKLQIKAHIR